MWTAAVLTARRTLNRTRLRQETNPSYLGRENPGIIYEKHKERAHFRKVPTLLNETGIAGKTLSNRDNEVSEFDRCASGKRMVSVGLCKPVAMRAKQYIFVEKIFLLRLVSESAADITPIFPFLSFEISCLR